MQLTAAGVVGYSMSGWLEAVAQQNANNPQRRRSCILLWMNGGPSQMDTFDLKPGHVNGGPFQETRTNVPGVRISEHLPKIARHMDKMAIIRAMSTREGDHARGTFYLRNGYLPQGPIQYPTLGSLVAKEIGAPDLPLPSFVSIAPYRQFSPAAFSSGFLGPQFAPLIVGESNNFNFNPQGQDNYDTSLQVQDMSHFEGVERRQFDARVNLLQEMERDFTERHQTPAARSHQTAYERAVSLMRTSARTAFNLNEETERVRDAYGRNMFGQGCLLARRLVERNVPFVEVTLGSFNNQNLGWDTHNQNFESVRRLSEILDPAWGTLMDDLRDRGLFDTTTIIWMGEFGRTPRITPNTLGREHYPNAWTTVLAGGGIRGGQVFGRTSADGTTVEEPRSVAVPDLIATVCGALGIDHESQNMSNVGRPIPIADRAAVPIREVLA
jgi:hypothetical protein